MTYIGEYRIFDYHDCDCDDILTPHHTKLDKNIKGVELEIDHLWSSNIDREYILECAIDDGVLISEDTLHMADEDYNAVISEDGSVDCEIGLQANHERHILNKIDELNSYGINSTNFNNSAGTSCHIHNNLQFIENNGGNMLEMQRVAEFLLPILFRISGRTPSSYGWARSRFEKHGECEIPMKHLLETARNADKVTSIDRTHSRVCNAEHSNTAEVRIFSNSFNFDRNMIKTYIEFTDHMIDMACYMNGKSYVNEYDSLIDWTSDFISGTRRRENSLEIFNLNELLIPKQDIALVDFNNRWRDVYLRLEALENNTGNTMEDQVMNVLRFVRHCDINCNTQLRFGVPTYTYKVDLESIRNEVNRQYTSEKENL